MRTAQTGKVIFFQSAAYVEGAEAAIEALGGHFQTFEGTGWYVVVSQSPLTAEQAAEMVKQQALDPVEVDPSSKTFRFAGRDDRLKRAVANRDWGKIAALEKRAGLDDDVHRMVEDRVRQIAEEVLSEVQRIVPDAQLNQVGESRYEIPVRGFVPESKFGFVVIGGPKVYPVIGHLQYPNMPEFTDALDKFCEGGVSGGADDSSRSLKL